MKIYLIEHVIGSFAYDQDGKLIDSVINQRELGKLTEELINNEKGVPFSSTIELLKKLKIDEVVTENEAEIPKLQELGYKAIYEPHNKVSRIFRDNVQKIAVESKFAKDEEDYYNFLYELSLEYTRRKLRSASQRRDLLAIQAVRAIDDIDKTINLFSERLREWYSIHFPELDKLIEDHREYASIVSKFGDRNSINKEDLSEIVSNDTKINRIIDAAKKSIGADISEDDLTSMRMISDTIIQLYDIRKNLTNYLESVMKEVAPNVTAIVGPTLGARLLSLAGSLEELAKMPASTIQVLGAEKALFRALRGGGRPPKHGVIFQYPAIHTSPRWQRGKIARALAAKLAIAARVDAFSGRFIGDQLNEQLKKRIEEIKEKYAQPPPRKPQQQPQKPKREEKGKKGGKRKNKRK
ncbi:C/D box methylation guide ribonucleoprotein complex aNOP56 subunit [Sulfolobus sp. A20]|nr:C/D box methylation guide ribonucleoprotein complex aNOP56 subunit [Sulfolobus sp. A20]TRM78177.1 C/D box methylation guide ribonucleoprotein complex aNOP56 subunit [Sulfolobus sp. A20-N-F8]TRM79374.1 C/D box methylation guide ribonucleoprotein complex aNOP56 subunit [Sulfolobus sp. B5]TRM84134.1 C/D box methylation guide ribonucleoprotein complex aNOP56 subunit [Sulfolobus sp. A20-N-F6]TRM88840.1 C/D box methylation guide ribonucleoprotein complex aNOP56 subunit [Sulfolobus sp. C3]TRM98266